MQENYECVLPFEGHMRVMRSGYHGAVDQKGRMSMVLLYNHSEILLFANFWESVNGIQCLKYTRQVF
jgi:hypothetical protein